MEPGSYARRTIRESPEDWHRLHASYMNSRRADNPHAGRLYPSYFGIVLAEFVLLAFDLEVPNG
jgi:hypothetical protein